VAAFDPVYSAPVDLDFAQALARVPGKHLDPSSVTTACAQTCPTEAIVFGSYDQGASELVKRASDPRAYELLHELGTRPRTV
jgi:molybdopterin-containing oxidoreductase family iron-sulfur binding subunit